MIAISQSFSERPKHVVARLIFWTIAAFYVYGTLVHILNMLSLTGFAWGAAPAKWQALDVTYLMLDVTVVVGLLRAGQIGIWAFFMASLSQIALYTLFRDWILDVPEAFRRSAEDIAYLDYLVTFHLMTCVAMSIAIWLTRDKGGRA